MIQGYFYPNFSFLATAFEPEMLQRLWSSGS